MTSAVGPGRRLVRRQAQRVGEVVWGNEVESSKAEASVFGWRSWLSGRERQRDGHNDGAAGQHDDKVLRRKDHGGAARQQHGAVWCGAACGGLVNKGAARGCTCVTQGPLVHGTAIRLAQHPCYKNTTLDRNMARLCGASARQASAGRGPDIARCRRVKCVVATSHTNHRTCGGHAKVQLHPCLHRSMVFQKR
jgi:hypothetical protein